MLKIGLTGGIGSGKTVVSDAFKELNVPIVDTDVIAREVIIKDESLLLKLVDTFGSEILDKNNTLDRSKLRDIAFINKENKKNLDNIMHPAIRQSTLEEVQNYEDLKHPYCIIVVPLLIETGFIKLVDRVLVVTAPLERKLQWLEKRSQLSPTKANIIMNKQSSDKEKLAQADDVINNDSDIENIHIKVSELHQQYLKLDPKKS